MQVELTKEDQRVIVRALNEFVSTHTLYPRRTNMAQTAHDLELAEDLADRIGMAHVRVT